MELTPEVLKPFKGGQFELEDRKNRFVLTGVSKSLTLTNNVVRLEYGEAAKSIEYPATENWETFEGRGLSIGLNTHQVSVVGKSNLQFRSGKEGFDRTIVLFQPGTTSLGPATELVGT